MLAYALLLLVAQTAPAAPAMDHSRHAAPAKPAAAAASRLNLDTPIETIVADPAGKAALETAIPGIAEHPAYEQFKGMSLNQVAPMSGGMLSPEVLAKAQAALAAVK